MKPRHTMSSSIRILGQNDLIRSLVRDSKPAPNSLDPTHFWMNLPNMEQLYSLAINSTRLNKFGQDAAHAKTTPPTTTIAKTLYEKGHEHEQEHAEAARPTTTWADYKCSGTFSLSSHLWLSTKLSVLISFRRTFLTFAVIRTFPTVGGPTNYKLERVFHFSFLSQS